MTRDNGEKRAKKGTKNPVHNAKGDAESRNQRVHFGTHISEGLSASGVDAGNRHRLKQKPKDNSSTEGGTCENTAAKRTSRNTNTLTCPDSSTVSLSSSPSNRNGPPRLTQPLPSLQLQLRCTRHQRHRCVAVLLGRFVAPAGVPSLTQRIVPLSPMPATELKPAFTEVYCVIMGGIAQVPILERDELVAKLAWNVSAYESIVKAIDDNVFSQTRVIPSLSAGMGMGKTFAMQLFGDTVRTLSSDVLRQPTVHSRLHPDFVTAEVDRLQRGSFKVVYLSLTGSVPEDWFDALVAAAKTLGLDDAATGKLNAIKCPDTHAKCLWVVLRVIATATWTPATETLFVFIDEAMNKGLATMRDLRTVLVGMYSCANRSIQRDQWDALPRMQLVLASAGLADRPDGGCSFRTVHRWLSVPPLTVAAVTNIRANLQQQRWLPVSTSPEHGLAPFDSLTSYTCV